MAAAGGAHDEIDAWLHRNVDEIAAFEATSEVGWPISACRRTERVTVPGQLHDDVAGGDRGPAGPRHELQQGFAGGGDVKLAGRPPRRGNDDLVGRVTDEADRSPAAG